MPKGGLVGGTCMVDRLPLFVPICHDFIFSPGSWNRHWTGWSGRVAFIASAVFSPLPAAFASKYVW